MISARHPARMAAAGGRGPQLQGESAGVTANAALAVRTGSSAFAPVRSGDVGDRMIGERQADVGRPSVVADGRTSLGRLGRPEPQVLENAPHDVCILDQGDDPHRPLALRAFERIGFVDLANEPRARPPWPVPRTR